ncbi:hypothetical protein DPMN_146199 [Dreissena polymorpha]|uniref:Uncharacterized protein n=1 Tax=Dreissena polymorpha TaxID=45954 RepID=A0A9D4F5G4_DREPO|nr:hypothetical protein DPMN_146199 [Dreissena polymorpha]
MTGAGVYCCGTTKKKITMQDVTMTITDLKVGFSDDSTSVLKGQFYGFELMIKGKK